MGDERTGTPSNMPRPVGRAVLPNIASCAGGNSHGRCAEELEELRASHAALMLHVSELQEDVQHTRKLALETESIVRGPSSMSELSIKRAVLFASIATRKVLTSNHPEMIRSYGK